MSSLPNGLPEGGNSRIHVTASEKGDTTWYAICALIIALLLLVYLILSIYGLIPDGSYNAMLTDDMLKVLSTFVFLIASALALIRSKNLKLGKGILAFTVSAILYFISAVAGTAFDLILHAEVPFPLVADAFHIMGSAMFIIALLLMIKSLTGKVRISPPVIAITAVGSAILAGALYLSSRGLSPGPIGLPTVIDITYPVFDFISLIFIVILLAVSPNKGVTQAHIILAAGVSLASISNMMFAIGTATGLYSNGSIAGFLSAGGFILFAVGVWRYIGLTKSDMLDDRLSKLKNRAIAR